MADIIPLSSVKISEERIRQRFDEKPLAALAKDIATNGLYHAVVLDADGQLIAGERRFRAISLLQVTGETFSYAGEEVPQGHIPTVTIPTNNPARLLEIELHENLMRQNLTWQEETAAVAALHELRASQNPHQTLKDTAQEIAGAAPVKAHDQTRVSQAVQIAKFLDDPEVKAAQTERIALRIAQKKAAVAAREGVVRIAPRSRHIIHHGSSITYMQNMMSESVDCILTDPPYGVDADKFNNPNTLKHAYEDSLDYALECYTTLASEGYRIAKPAAHLYTFLDIIHFDKIRDIFLENGWIVWPRPFIWYKGNMGFWPDQNYGPKRTYEAILYARKGDRKVLECAHDVINIPSIQGVERQAAKPPALYHNILKRVCLAGDVVFDPFCGSGPIIPAANTLDLTAICCDIDPEAIELCNQKVEMKV